MPSLPTLSVSRSMKKRKLLAALTWNSIRRSGLG
jgi:hypothetical protein